MLKLNNLKAPAGSNHGKKRKGRGIGSKLGKTAGKGHKGQLARAGGYVPPDFEGGQMPVQRRSPKVGFRSWTKDLNVKINVTELGHFAGATLKLKDLAPKGKAGLARMHLTVVGTKAPKAFPKALEAHKVAPAAKAMLDKAGVAVTLVPHMHGELGKKKTKTAKAAK